MSELARIRRMLAPEGGRATITIRSPRDAHATFRIKHNARNGRVFVDVESAVELYGWRGVGELLPGEHGGHRFKPWRGTSRELTYAIELVVAALGEHADDDYLATITGGPYEVQAASVCGACGRKLTHPDSIPVGIGPECAARLGEFHPGYGSQHVAKGRKRGAA